MDDVRAVMDAVGSKQAVLLGVSDGGPMSLLYAATYPERTVALIIYGSYARRLWASDHPYGNLQQIGMDSSSGWSESGAAPSPWTFSRLA